MTKQRVIIEENGKLTLLSIEGDTIRLGVRFMPEGAADPEVKKRLQAKWREMIERSDDQDRGD